MNLNRSFPARPVSATAPGARARRRRRSYLTGVIALSAAAALAGCAAEAALTPVVDSSADPFTAYLAEEMDTIRFTQDVLRLQCYTDNGYPAFAASIPTEPGAGWQTRPDQLDQLTVNDAFFESGQDAAASGLRGEPFGPSPAKVFVHDDAFEAVSTACDTKAWEALGKGAEQTLVDYNRLSSKLSGGLFDGTIDGLVPLRQEVVECLADDGEPVTPASDQLYGFTSDVQLGEPVEYPERSGPKQSSGVETIPGDVEITYAPTRAEAELAVKYYNCSVDTGVREEFAALIQETKKEVVAEHAAELEKLNPRIAELADAASKLSGS